MLNTLRKAAGTWVAKILFFLLILSFGAWGIGDFLRPTANTAVAKVGDTEISQIEFSRAFRREMEGLRQRSGGALTQEMAIQLGFGSQVLSSLVESKLLSVEAHDLGVRISDDVVRQRILAEPGFQEGGGFNRQRFLQALQMNGLSEDQFVELLRNDLTREVVSTAVASGVTVPKTLADSLYRFRQEERVAELLYLPNDTAGTVGEPSDADLKSFYDKDTAPYTAPERRALTSLSLRPEDLIPQISISDDKIRETYEARPNEFRIPEARQVSQLLFVDEAPARAASEKLRGGAPFADVATEVTANGAQRTDLGEVREGDLFPKAVETAVFALPKPGATEPVHSPIGWHVLFVDKITPGSMKPLETVREQIRHELASDRAVDDIISLSNQLEDTLAGGATLEQAGQQLNLPVLKIAAIERTGKDADGKPIENLPRSPAFMQLAFEIGKGEVSRLTETADGGYFILRVDDITPRAPKPFETVKNEVAAAWRTAELRKLAEKEAETIGEAVRGGKSIAEAGSARSLNPTVTAPFTRQANLPAERLPATLVGKLFGLAVGEVATAAMPDGVVIAKLTEIKPADPAAAADRVAELRSDLARRMTNDIQAQYAAALQKRHGVTINEDALQRAL